VAAPLTGSSAAEWSPLSGFQESHAGDSCIAGPSFLGLAADARVIDFEEEPPRRHLVRYVVAGVLSALIMLAAISYRAYLPQMELKHWAQVRQVGLQYWTPVRVAGMRYWTPVRAAGMHYADLAAGYLRKFRGEGNRTVAANNAPLSASPGPEDKQALEAVQAGADNSPGAAVESTPASATSALTSDRPAPPPAAADEEETESIADSGQQMQAQPSASQAANAQSVSPQQSAQAASADSSEKLPQAKAQPAPSETALASADAASRPGVNAAGAAAIQPRSTITVRGQYKDPAAQSQGAPPARELPQRDTEPYGQPTANVKTGLPRPPEHLPATTAAGESEYRLALATSNGDLARALLWRAISHGNTDAQVRLGEMYIYGQGVPPNCGQGLVLLRSAAQKGNARASSKLGALYSTGKCVPQDRVTAYRWFSQALQSDPANEWVSTNRQIVWRQMSPEERALAAGNGNQ
jgi:TPR repeat protein